VANAPALGGVSFAESEGGKNGVSSAGECIEVEPFESWDGARSDAFILSGLEVPLPTWLPRRGLAIETTRTPL
jgi:hypothetical protein